MKLDVHPAVLAGTDTSAPTRAERQTPMGFRLRGRARKAAIDRPHPGRRSAGLARGGRRPALVGRRQIAFAIAVVVTDALLVGRVARHAVQSGHASSPLYGSTVAHVVVLAIATALSVFKPLGRTPWSRVNS